MSSSITLSAATRQNLLSLQDTANLLATTQTRLSTGKKVNSALDNPTNFFTSQSLTARSSDLSALLDGMSNGVQVIQAANQGITSIQKLLDSAKSTAQQALADKTGGSSGLTGGSAAQTAKVNGGSTLASLGTTANGTTTFDLSSPTKDASLDISLDGGNTKTTIRLDSNSLSKAGLDLTKVTSDQLLSAISNQISASSALNGKVTASIGTDGRLAFATTATGASAKLSVAGSADSTVDIGYGKSSIPPTAATVTATNALSAITNFANGASASLSVSDGSKNVTITLNSDSLLSDGTTKLGNAATAASIQSAIQYQLTQAGSSATVSVDGATNKLVFTSSDTGPDAALTVTGGADSTIGGATGATGIGFTSFNSAGSTSVAPTDLSVSNAVAGTVAGPAVTSTGAAGVTAFGKALPTSGSITIPATLDTTFSVGGQTVTLKASSPTGTGSDTLATHSTLTDVLGAINAQLHAAGSAAASITAGADSSGHITFTDANQANAAPTVSITDDYLGLLSSPASTKLTAAFNGTTFDLTGNKAAAFTISDASGNTKSVTINADSPKSGQATLGNNNTNAVSSADVLDSINTQLAGTKFKAYVDTAGKLNFVGSDPSASALTISNASDTTGAAVFADVAAGAAGTQASSSTTTQSAQATATAANAATTLNANSFGTGGHTTFTVNGTAVTVGGASLYDSDPAHTLASDPSKLAQAVNVAMQGAGVTGVTASLTGGKLVFSASNGGSTPPAIGTNGGSNTDQLGLFGTPATTTLTTDLSTKLVNGSLDLSGGKSSSFKVSGTTVTVSATATDGNGGSGTLGTSATLAALAKSVNAQLNGTGYSAYINSQNKLTFVSADSQSAPPAITPTAAGSTGLTDALGLGLGTAASTTAGTAAAFNGNGTIDLSAGKSSTFNIGDGTNSTTVTINQNSTTDGTTPIGANATKAQVAAAIQYQLNNATSNGNPAPVKATVSFDAASGKLTVTSQAVGSQAKATLSGISDTAQLGVGSTVTTNGTYTQGTGQAAIATTATGSAATDGSSQASIVGTDQSAYPTRDFSGTKDASFTLKLGDGPMKMISLNSSTFGSSATTSQSAIAKAINDQIAADTGLAGKVSASYVNNKLVISTTASGSNQKLAVSAAQATSGGVGAVDIGFGISGQGATAQTASGTDVGGSKGISSARSSLAAQYNQILQQISRQAQDSGYNGVNLLYRDSNNAADNTLHITFNEKNTSALDIQGVRFDATGLGLDAVSGNFQTDTEITAAIDSLSTATSLLRSQSSTFGSNLMVVQNRQDFTKAITNILDTGAANLTNADLNEEAANSQALSTRNSLAISALSLANQAQQGILQLLR
ncbi:hypothetical protein MMB17_22195 [Methylobacterium organophilum]|uniref:flagellin N-terminal helical domain-containing protein n=1 Tax=Methylobacterium organophilum TaxID=410 RepID=UPI001F137D52|nr:flagellin [Methylobacterium organophilum]UMY17308.1 hypothetical protein MMB17_22195 [Methylobacterium organophilum]